MTSGSADHPEISALEQQQLKVMDPSAETFWHRVRFSLVTDEVARTSATGVLDFGAGSGRLGNWLQAREPGVRYTFRESSPPLAAELRRRFGAAGEVPDGSTIGGDVVVAMLDVLEHIEDDAVALRSLWAEMAAGGVLVITVPALQALFSSWDTRLGHYRRYSKGSLAAVLTAAGFQVESSGYLFPELLPVVALRKVQHHGSGEPADFPLLPRWLNALGYAISATTARLRRWMPAGTSVVAVARRSA